MPTIQQPGAAVTPRQTTQGAGGADAALTSALQGAGLLAGGQDPTAVGKALVKNLLSRGFYGGMGALPAQVSKALSAFQKAKGLPITGKLDAATLNVLGQLGLLPGRAEQVRRQGGADGFDRPVAKVQDRTEVDLGRNTAADAGGKGDAGASPQGLGQQLKQAAQALLGRLGLGGGGERAGEGAGQAAGHAGADGAPAHGEGAHGGTPQAATSSSASANATSSRSQAADGAHIPQTRSGALGDKTADQRGSQGDPNAEKGRTKKRGDKAGRIGDEDGEDEDGATRQGQGEGGADAEGEDGHEADPGNATSGDDDLSDRDRGHASAGRDEDEAGHYRMPTLAEQLEAALDEVTRAGETANRAAAYSLDVTFYKPGVYGPGQKAPELLHAHVDRAEAFDPAWDQLVEGLERMVARHAPGTPVPDRDTWAAALRRARYRDPS